MLELSKKAPYPWTVGIGAAGLAHIKRLLSPLLIRAGDGDEFHDSFSLTGPLSVALINGRKNGQSPFF